MYLVQCFQLGQFTNRPRHFVGIQEWSAVKTAASWDQKWLPLFGLVKVPAFDKWWEPDRAKSPSSWEY